MFDSAIAQKVLRECAIIFDNISLSYFLSYGTALGAHRDKGFTPYELDIDIGFLVEDVVPKTGSLVRDLIDHHYQVRTVHGRFTIPYAIVAEKSGIKVDMVGLIPWNDQVYGGGLVRLDPCHDNPDSAVWPGELFEGDLTVHMFGRDWPMPFMIEEYLEHTYGKMWRVPARGPNHHHFILGYQEEREIPSNFLERFLTKGAKDEFNSRK